MSDPSFPLCCPVCEADVAYDDLIEVEGEADCGQCPECGEVSPVEGGWFE